MYNDLDLYQICHQIVIHLSRMATTSTTVPTTTTEAETEAGMDYNLEPVQLLLKSKWPAAIIMSKQKLPPEDDNVDLSLFLLPFK